MRIVIALGGNALSIDCEDQLQVTKKVAKTIVDLMEQNHEVIITHGNGPQVGLIYNAFEESKTNMPLAECGAMSQGYIGYHLSTSINNELKRRNINKYSCCITTQILVDKNDEGFINPTKAIGKWYSKDEISDLNFDVKYYKEKDGYRRVVASPLPKEIIEIESIKKMISKDNLVICCGGGGIPVIRNENLLERTSAVIDKDMASSLLASNIDADMLIILTSVDFVKLNFKKENELTLHNVKTSELKGYLDDNQFEKGTMEPKIKSCINFVNNDQNKIAVITTIENLLDAVSLKKGTIIRK